MKNINIIFEFEDLIKYALLGCPICGKANRKEDY